MCPGNGISSLSLLRKNGGARRISVSCNVTRSELIIDIWSSAQAPTSAATRHNGRTWPSMCRGLAPSTASLPDGGDHPGCPFSNNVRHAKQALSCGASDRLRILGIAVSQLMS